MTHIEPANGDQCLLCLVRQMTEGTPPIWSPKNPGDTVTGVVMRKDTVPSPFSLPPPDHIVPILDLWTGDTRVRVMASVVNLRLQVEKAEIQVGDTVTVTFLGKQEVVGGKFAGRKYARFTLDVKRGHH